MIAATFIKQYFKYLLITAVSVISLIFLLPLIPSIYFAAKGHPPSNAYIASGLFIIALIKRFYYFAFITPIILIFLKKKFPNKTSRVFLFEGLITVGLCLTSWTSVIAFDYTKTLLNDSWKARIQFAQHLGKGQRDKISDDLCKTIEDEVNFENKDLQEALAQINKSSKDAGFKLATEDVYISRGYITYYFKPSGSEELDALKEKTIKIFKENYIGPTLYWLNIDWYNNYIKKDPDRNNTQLIDIEDDLIRIRYETVFPLLNEFFSEGILQTPPPHVLKTAKESGLKFVRSERRDFWGYSYSVPTPFFQLLGENFNIDYSISSKRTKEGYVDTQLEKISCRWPQHSLKSTNLGQPPSREISYPPTPVEIPACHEYRTWLRCQKVADNRSCTNAQFRKGADEPVCKQPEVLFPKEIYGPKSN